MLSQSTFIKNRIHSHRGSSPTHILDSVDQLAKGAQAMAHELLIIRDEVRILQNANIALAKRRRSKKIRLQNGGALTQEKSKILLAEKDKRKRVMPDDDENASNAKKSKVTSRRCGACGETGHNARTCPTKID